MCPVSVVQSVVHDLALGYSIYTVYTSVLLFRNCSLQCSKFFCSNFRYNSVFLFRNCLLRCSEFFCSNFRRPGEESDASDDYRDTGSEGSSSSDEAERDSKYGGAIHWRNSNAFDCNLDSNTRFDRLTLRSHSKAAQEGFSSDDGEGSSCPSFQYFERAIPYSREPLADKIGDLAKDFPQLKTLRSIDLSPTSWLSIAWYLIYRIPTGPTLRDLAACFLTFHSLSTPLKDGGSIHVSTGGKSVPVTPISNSGGSPKIDLTVFGPPSYKLKGTVWSTNGNCERQQANSLFQLADQWLRLNQVKHPDYDFFLSHGSSYGG